jgi:hypothetical protein
MMLVDMPDYTWYAGCFGTASGNLMGYWDRNGFADFYTGSVNGGVAPLTSGGQNVGIRLMWASTAHMNDYWTSVVDDSSYESTAPDPYVMAGRAEHTPDCIGDFIGLSQNKWTNLDDECSGNVDAFSFNFWDKTGAKRLNFAPQTQAGVVLRDIQSGLRAWTQFKGHDADVFSQFVDFNPETPAGTGFTFEDFKAEIDSGYPVLFFLQTPGQYYRSLGGGGQPLLPKGNPEIHGIVGYGYYITDDGHQYVRIKNSWGSSGDTTLVPWTTELWFNFLDIKVRGVIGYHPKPRINGITSENGQLRIRWDGALSSLVDFVNAANVPASWFVVEKASTVDGEYVEVSDPVSEHEALVPDTGEKTVFYRIKGVRRPAL